MEEQNQRKVVIELQNVKRNFIVGDEVCLTSWGVWTHQQAVNIYWMVLLSEK